MIKKRITAGLLGTAAVVGLNSIAVAQQSSASGEEAALREVIVVRGIRQSILSAQELKREADSIIDAVTAEDIGKFTGENVAEALQRVPGVQIDREGGEGRFVSVRGLGPQFNRTTINGRTAISIGLGGREDNRAFNFDSIASEMIAAIEVVKTPTANMDEGGIGGVVNLRTPRPLDLRLRGHGRVDSVLTGAVEGTYNELADARDPRASIFASHRLTDRFGLLAAISYDERTLRQDIVDAPNHRIVDLDIADNLLRVGNLRHRANQEVRERLGANLAAQWQPTSSLDIVVDALYTQFESASDRNMFQTAYAARNIVYSNETLNDDQTVITSFDAANVPLAFLPQYSDGITETVLAGVNVTWEEDPWKVSADLSIGDLQYRNDFHSNVYSGPGRADVSYNATGDVPVLTTDYELLDVDPSSLAIARVQTNITDTTQTEHAAQFDVERRIDDGFFTAWRGGMKFRQRENDVIFNVFQFSRPEFLAAANEAGIDVAPVLGEFPFSNYAEDYGIAISQWLTIDPRATTAEYGPALDLLVPGGFREFARNNPDPTQSFGADEDIFSAYVMADFAGDLGQIPFSGNFGLRYADTTTLAKGFAFDDAGSDFVPQAIETSYEDILPSGNLKLGLSEKVVLRLAAARVITRPDLIDLTPTVVVQNISNGVARSGNPALDPFRANQYDVYLEWYPGDVGASLALGYFHKDIKSFTTSVTTVEEVPGFTSGPDAGLEGLFNVTRPVTEGNEATIDGLEVAGFLPFEMLSERLEPFGLRANYTYVDSESSDTDSLTGQTLGVEGVAEHNYNAVGFYENDRFSIRLSYTYRDEFLSRRNAPASGSSEFTEAYGQLDLSASLDLNDRISLTFHGINLTDEIAYRYLAYPDAFRLATDNARRFILGVRGRM